MTQQQRALTQEMANRLTTKLQAFLDGLPQGEQQVLTLLLRQAAAEGAKDGYNVGAVLQVGPIRGATSSESAAPGSEHLTIPLIFPG